MSKLYSVLYDSNYSSIKGLSSAICSKLDEDLGAIVDYALSGEYSLEDIAYEINKVREMIKGVSD